jgi:hypothetical protein
MAAVLTGRYLGRSATPILAESRCSARGPGISRNSSTVAGRAVVDVGRARSEVWGDNVRFESAVTGTAGEPEARGELRARLPRPGRPVRRRRLDARVWRAMSTGRPPTRSTRQSTRRAFREPRDVWWPGSVERRRLQAGRRAEGGVPGKRPLMPIGLRRTNAGSAANLSRSARRLSPLLLATA